MSLPYYTLSSLGISKVPPPKKYCAIGTPDHILLQHNPIVSRLKTMNQNSLMLTRERKHFNKAAILFFFSLFSFPAPTDVRSEVTQSDQFKFLKNVSIRSVLHEFQWGLTSSETNMLLRQFLDPKRTRLPRHAARHHKNERKKRIRADCSYYNY